MIKEHEVELLWDSVTILKDQNKIENAKALFKKLVERTFSTLKVSTEILDELNITAPTTDMVSQIRLLDKEIHQALKEKNTLLAYKYLVDYILELSKSSLDMNSKEIFAKILATHLNEMNTKTMLEEDKMEVYTSTEVAEIMGVSDQTIRRWCEKGKYPDAFQTEGGHWRIPKKYFKLTLEHARKRKALDEKLNQFNKRKGEVTEDEFL